MALPSAFSAMLPAISPSVLSAIDLLAARGRKSVHFRTRFPDAVHAERTDCAPNLTGLMTRPRTGTTTIVVELADPV